MNMITKTNIFQEHLREGLRAKDDRKKRGEITRHIVFVTKMHENSISRKFKAIHLRGAACEDKRGRPPYYGNDVTAALKDVWEVADEPCGEILNPMIDEYVAILQRDGMWKHEDDATDKLCIMSQRTVKRRVGRFIKMRNGMSYFKHSRASAPKNM